MIIREIELSDAEKLSALIQQVEASSEYMLLGPGEREVDNERQKNSIKRFKESANSTLLVAENDCNELVGYLVAIGGEVKRNQYTAYIVVGISQQRRGQGIGTKLFEALDRWALVHGMHRLELTVVTKNDAGLSLYKKMGFEIEGTKRDSLFIDHTFVDEYYMSKLIEPVLC